MFDRLKENLKKISISLFYLTLGLFTFISIVSYSPLDNTLFKFDLSLSTSKNWMGPVGSILSGALMQAIGHSSYLISVFFIFRSLRSFFDNSMTWYSWAFLPFSILSVCFLGEFIAKNFSFFLFFDGGLLGSGLNLYFNHFLVDFAYVNFITLFIFFISIFFISLSYNIRFSELRQFVLILTRLLTNALLLLAVTLRVTRKVKFKTLFEKNKSVSNRSLKTSNDKKHPLVPKLNPNYVFPSLELLEKSKKIPGMESENKKSTQINRELLTNVLNDFRISGNITEVKQGPIVTLFELTPAPGTQSSSVIRLSDDIARSMSATSTRISTIPGKDALGIEIPNKHRETVFLRELLDHDLYKSTKCKLPLTLGKDILGKPVIVDLAKMPHLLVAGTTGSGKSVGINAMLLSLLYSLTPEECRLILIDPKMLELSVYQNIPHLLTEVVTDTKKAVSSLKWTVKEMESRYEMMTNLGVRDIDDYNARVRKILDDGEVIFKEIQVGYDSETGVPVMEKKALDLAVFPKIVVVVDELADLMITSGKEIENAIQRLSQMARAAGIHLIVATQRPSVDVITGTIKSNFPTRISYKVVNKINSRTILEEQGAEQLLGQGDLLITMPGERLLRVHGPYVRTEEVQSVVEHIKKQGEPDYLQSVTLEEEEIENFSLGLNDGADDLYNQAVAIVCREKKASTSFIQRHLKIGYNRAATIIEKMESEGIVSAANHVGRREVLVGKDN